MNNQRQFRMPVSRRGLVILDKTMALCEVMDITEQGLHFSTAMPFALDEKVRMSVNLMRTASSTAEWNISSSWPCSSSA